MRPFKGFSAMMDDEPVGEEDRPSRHHVTGDNRAVIPL